jgi:hypothetical protein
MGLGLREALSPRGVRSGKDVVDVVDVVVDGVHGSCRNLSGKV